MARYIFYFIRNFFVLLILSILCIILVNCSSYQKKNDIEKAVKLKPPLNFLILGDSMIGGYFGLILTKELKRIPGFTARRIYAKSTGLSEYIRHNWKLKTKIYIKKFKPDILITMFGSNDTLALRLKNGKLIYYKNPLWRKIYAERVYQYLKLVSPLVKKIYFMGQPSTNHKSLAFRYPVLNSIYKKESRKIDNVSYIPAWKWTSVSTKYVKKMMDNNGKIDLVKTKNDPIHHSPFGGRVLAELLIDYIKRDIEIKLK